jgi:hypothetical protein
MQFCLKSIEREDILAVIPQGMVLPPPSGLPLMIRYANTFCGHQQEYNSSCGADLDCFKIMLTNAVQQNNLQLVSNMKNWFERKVERDRIALDAMNQMEVDDQIEID